MVKRILLTIAAVFAAQSAFSAYYYFSQDGYTFSNASSWVDKGPDDLYISSTSEVRHNLVLPTKVTHDGITHNIIEVGSGCFMTGYADGTLTIPEGYKLLSARAFRACAALTGTIKMPSTMQLLQEEVFFECTNIEHVEFNEGLKKIGQNAFNGCRNLKGTIKMPSTLTEISGRAFANTPLLEKAIFPASLKRITNEIFMNSGISEVVFPEGIEIIQDLVLGYCPNLKSVVFPSSLQWIGDYMFRGSKVESITIKPGVQKIGYYFIDDAEVGSSVTIPNTVTEYKTGFITYSTIHGNINLPNSFKTLKTYTINGCTVDGSINIPEGVEKLQADALSGVTVGGRITIPRTVTELPERAVVSAYGKPKSKLVTHSPYMEAKSFENCDIYAPQPFVQKFRDIVKYEYQKKVLPYGDVNNDDVTDIADLNILIDVVLGLEKASKYGDAIYVTDDKSVDIADINDVINSILGM